MIVDLQVKNMGGMAVVREIKASLEGEDALYLVILLDQEVDGFLAKHGRRCLGGQAILGP